MDAELLERAMKRKVWISTGIAACFLAAIALFCAWKSGYFLPGWIIWESKEISCDRESREPDKIVLVGKQVSVFAGQDAVWQSGRELRVQDVLWCDMDHDSQKELILLCWKRGRYGESRPFWVTEEEKNWSQHIYIYDWADGGIRPIWMASDIGLEVAAWRFDEAQRLILTDREGRESAWDWLSWGLSRIELRQETREKSQLTFAALGDNLIHRQIYEYAFRHFDGCFDDLFAYVQQELNQYDVCSINQESIYVNRPEQYSSYPLFGTPVQVGDAVIKAGFDIVSCATNHALDMGTEAIDLTASVYRDAGVLCVGIQPVSDGAYRPYEIFEKNGIRCAVFSYTLETNGHALPEDAPYVLHTLRDEQQVREDLLAGREAADFCIVYVHWGTEYSDTPDAEQERWAAIFSDCGADVVIGTHPHVVQPVEWITGEGGQRTLVFYSLGNFISAQTEEACRTGALAYFTVTKEEGQCSITDYGTKPLITEEEQGHYTTKLAESP